MMTLPKSQLKMMLSLGPVLGDIFFSIYRNTIVVSIKNLEKSVMIEI